MPFFTRPNLSDIEFKQIAESLLTLSGSTDFVGVLKSKGIEIDATIIGPVSGVTGHVLTYIGGKIQLAPAGTGSTGGDTNFNSARATTRSGIPAVNVGGSTVNQFLEGYFFPSVVPVASITGGGTRLFGNNAGFNLTWSVTRRTNPLVSGIVNGTSITGLITGLAQNASTGGVVAAVINTPNTNQSYSMNIQTASESVNDSTSVTFSHKRFFYGDNQDLIPFNDAATSANVNLNEVGGKSEFSGSKAKSAFNITLAGQFFYYVYPAALGAASFTINGLSNTDFSFKDFTFTNSFGYATTFRMYRTNNILNGTFSIAVS